MKTQSYFHVAGSGWKSRMSPFVLVAVLAAGADAQVREQAKVQAPADHVMLKRTVSGGYFVTKSLKDEYERAVNRLQSLKADIDGARTTGAAALRERAERQGKLDGLRTEIEGKKVFVPIAQAETDTETVTFELGPERCLLIAADDVHVVGWEQSGVKCELVKTALSVDGKRDEAELAAIKLVHRHSHDRQKVGRTKAEVEADEKKFLESEAGQALTPEGREQRARLVEEIRGSWDHLRDFQGKEIDLLEIEGLTYQQGNRQFGTEIAHAAGRTMGSEWRRHARLTVYVPACNHVAVTGGGIHNLTCMDVQSLKASLVLWSSGTNKSAHSELFQVRGLEGSLTSRQI